MKLNLFIKIFIIYISFFLTNLYAENKYLKEGINYFKIKDFEKAKFKFEQDIVRNPKSESAYLYLADIFKEENKKINKNKIFKL